MKLVFAFLILVALVPGSLQETLGDDTVRSLRTHTVKRGSSARRRLSWGSLGLPSFSSAKYANGAALSSPSFRAFSSPSFYSPKSPSFQAATFNSFKKPMFKTQFSTFKTPTFKTQLGSSSPYSKYFNLKRPESSNSFMNAYNKKGLGRRYMNVAGKPGRGSTRPKQPSGRWGKQWGAVKGQFGRLKNWNEKMYNELYLNQDSGMPSIPTPGKGKIMIAEAATDLIVNNVVDRIIPKSRFQKTYPHYKQIWKNPYWNRKQGPGF